MKENKIMGAFLALPLLGAIGYAYFQIIWMIPLVIFISFGVVSLLPFCRKRENLWLFVLSVVPLLVMNICILNRFSLWKEFFCPFESGIFYALILVEYSMILVGIEEIFMAMAGRKIWKKQYRLNLE